MGNLSERLSRGAEILEKLDRKREEGAMSAEDCDLEYGILIVELWDLEEEILSDPGALEQYVVPVFP